MPDRFPTDPRRSTSAPGGDEPTVDPSAASASPDTPAPSTGDTSSPLSPDGASPDGEGDDTGAQEADPALSDPLAPSRQALELVVGGATADPHSVLGAHQTEQGTVIRTLRPGAQRATVLLGGKRYDMQSIHESGVFAVLVPGDVADYRIEVDYDLGTYTVDDPYRWLPTLGEIDLHLLGEGRHEQMWDVLGAHVRTYDTPGGEVTGTSFAVWAPNARGVRVTGDFSFWDSSALPMRVLGSTGVWELFVPGVEHGARYKFQVLGADSEWREKADPFAFHTEVPPQWASIVWDSRYEWTDHEWMDARVQAAAHERPMSTYEVHLGSWRQGLSYEELADQLVDYVTEQGFTHVELMPVAEHPFGGSWGYHVTGYYAPTARFGSPDQFRHLVDTLHRAGIGVIVDWVPGHFATDPWSLVQFDGTALYEHPDPKRGWHPEWGSYIFNHGRREVRNFLVANAIYWCEEYHVDGLRVDGVASMLYLDYSRKEGEWIPNSYGGRENLEAVAFLQETNATVYKRVPGVAMIAEESTSWPGVTRATHLGGLGFGLKWNMGWMHDTLDYLAVEPIYRSYHHHQLTFSMMYAYSENFALPLSHDEVVHGKGSLLRKMPGDRWQQLANLRALYAYMWAHPGKQLLFMGGEMAQEAEWSEERSLDWWLLDNADHAGVQHLVRDLNQVYRDSPALWSQDTDPAGFAWIDANDSANNVFSFLRWGNDGSVIACVINFAGVPHEGYRLGLPRTGRWDEVLNTDAETYCGSGVGNMGSVQAAGDPWHGQPASTTLRVPPLGGLWLRYAGD